MLIALIILGLLIFQDVTGSKKHFSDNKPSSHESSESSETFTRHYQHHWRTSSINVKFGDLNGSCSINKHCQWKHAICRLKKCVCPQYYPLPDHETKYCVKNTTDKFYCRDDQDCKNWKNMFCSSQNKCICPYSEPLWNTKRKQCEKGDEGSECESSYQCKSDFCYNNKCKSQLIVPTLPHLKGQLNSFCNHYYICTAPFTICVNNLCRCSPDYPRVVNGRFCKPPAGVGSSCRHNHDCRANLVCRRGYCQSVSSTDTDLIERTQHFALGFGIVIIVLLILLSICACISKRRRSASRRRNSRSLTIPHRSSTQSTLQLLAELNDHPPLYSDVYLIEPQSSESKPPTYEEALAQCGWQPATLVVAGNDNLAFDSETEPIASTSSATQVQEENNNEVSLNGSLNSQMSGRFRS